MYALVTPTLERGSCIEPNQENNVYSISSAVCFSIGFPCKLTVLILEIPVQLPSECIRRISIRTESKNEFE